MKQIKRKSWKHYSKHEAIAILEVATKTQQIKLDQFEAMALKSKSFSSQFYNRMLVRYKLINVHEKAN